MSPNRPLVAAARTGKTVNIKKGQFMAPASAAHAVTKVRESGNDNVCLTERGTMHGYGDLVVDMRGLAEMRAFAPTIMDLTHSLQQPNQASGVTGGRPELIATMARAAVAAGVDGVFIETHPDPANAFSDGANMLPLDQLECSPPWPASTSGAKPTLDMTFSFRTILTTSAFLAASSFFGPI